MSPTFPVAEETRNFYTLVTISPFRNQFCLWYNRNISENHQTKTHETGASK